jgi:hypothetical protein
LIRYANLPRPLNGWGGQQRGSARGQMQKISTGKFHFEPPFRSFDHLIGAGSADELPEVTPVVPPEKTLKEPSKRHPRPKDAARKLQRQTVVLPPKKPPIPDSTEAVRPEGTEGQSAPSQHTPRWLPSRWPEAPPPGRFSR